MARGLSSLSKKFLMGITGLVWTGFVLAHMVGNILLFVGDEAYNSYSHALTSGHLIYVIETILVGALLTHIGLAIRLTIENRQARPQAYSMSPNGAKGAKNPASKTMIIHGSILLFFVVYHLITFKYGTVYMTKSASGEPMRDIFKLVVEVFQNPGYVVGYAVCMGLLATHLSHGFGSALQSLGLNHSGFEKKIKCFSWAYALIVAGGFIVQPIFVFFYYKN